VNSHDEDGPKARVRIKPNLLKQTVITYTLIVQTNPHQISVSATSEPDEAWVIGKPESITLRDDVAGWIEQNIKQGTSFVGQEKDGSVIMAFDDVSEATLFKMRWS
jgi:hypothetical protein